jgi:hypothetical protein
MAIVFGIICSLLFMGGYCLGWRHRAEKAKLDETFRRLDNIFNELYQRAKTGKEA